MKFFKIAAVAIGGVLPFAMAAAPARAETKTFDWTLTGPAANLGGVPLPGAGTIVATQSTTANDGRWLVDSITGEVGGDTITGLSNFFGANNLLYPNGTTSLSTSGLGFTTTAGNVDIFSFFAQGSVASGNAYGEFASPGGFGVGTFTVTAVPETSTWVMMMLGFAGLGLAGYRRTTRNGARLAVV